MNFVANTYIISNRVKGREDTNEVGPVRFLIRPNEPQSNYSADAAGFVEMSQPDWIRSLLNDLNRLRQATNRPADLTGYIHGFDIAYSSVFPDLQIFGRGLAAAGFPGVMIGVTWPSFTHLDIISLEGSYGRAQDNAKASFPVLNALLTAIAAAQRGAVSTAGSMVCHSMGNFLLAEGVGKVNVTLPRKLSRILMLAADVDNRLFNGNARGPQIVNLAVQVDVYYSGNDSVLEFSEDINHDFRLGLRGPASYQGLLNGVAGLDCTAQVATKTVADMYVPVAQSSITNYLVDVVVHSSYRYTPALQQDESQAIQGLQTPHRQSVGGATNHFELIRFPGRRAESDMQSESFQALTG